MEQLLNDITSSPNITPGWYKCLSCSDYGSNCNGPSLTTLGDISSVRAFHKAMLKARKINYKKVAEAAKEISESTINEYFSNVVKDFKWTTVVAIDKALLSICGNRIGLPPLDHACPASSSEVRQQLAAADLRVAAAELRAAQSETTVADLQTKIIDVKAKSATRIDQMESDFDKNMLWMKQEVRRWQFFSFILAIMAVVMLVLFSH